jgi:hypothetical protein
VNVDNVDRLCGQLGLTLCHITACWLLRVSEKPPELNGFSGGEGVRRGENAELIGVSMYALELADG